MVKFSVRHPVSITMLIGVLVVLGIVSLSRMGLDLMPDISYPAVTVITRYPGAAPEEVENMVTKPIEEAVARISGVRKVSSLSYEGLSVVTVEFNWGKNLDFAAQDVRDRIGLVEKYLPEDVDKPLVFKFDVSMMPILEYGVTSDKRPPEEIKRIIEDHVKPALEKLDGVAQVQIFGGRDREIWVELDPAKLTYYELSTADIVNALRFSNLNLPAGHMERGATEYLIRLIGEIEDVDELNDAIVGFTKYGMPVHLRDIGHAYMSLSERRGVSTIEGKEGISIEILKQSGTNTVKVAERVKRELDEIKKVLPSDIKFVVISDQSKTIRRVTSRTTSNAYIGALLAAIAIFIFLRNLRPTLVISIAIPLSVIIAFIVLYFAGYTLNVMTLGGIALGVGMLVDNAIVVIENIFRHLEEEGEDRKTAAINATEEVGLAITSSTFTNIVVFLPLLYVGGIVGRLITPLAVTVTLTLLSSLAVAITIIPMLSSVFFKERKTEEEYGKAFGETWFQPVRTAYSKVLNWVLRRKFVVAGIAFLVFFATLALVPALGLRFMPDIDQDFGIIKITLPTGTKLDETLAYTHQIEEIAASKPETDFVGSMAGEGSEESAAFLGVSGTNEAMVFVIFKEAKYRKRKSYDVMREIINEIPKYRGAKVERMDFLSMAYLGGRAPIEIKLYGKDLSTLKGLAEAIRKEVAQVEGASNLHLSLEEAKPELRIHIDKEVAARYGLMPALVQSQVKAAIQGEFSTRVNIKGEDIDVIVKFPKTEVDNIEKIKRIPVKTMLGSFVPLGEIADIEMAYGPLKIEREKQARMIAVLGEPAKGHSVGKIMRAVENKLSSLRLPTGYNIEYGGEFKQIKDMLHDFSFAIAAAIILVYMVMAALFESFKDPFIVMFTVPLAIIGVIIMLFLTDIPISVPSLVGVLILSGIVVNNAIVMIDYIKKLRERGLHPFDAVIKGATRRLRPILITATTTILGMLPMALSHSEGAEMRAPMAISVIGGLLMSTLLTLFVIPSVYAIFEGIKPPKE